MEREKEKERKRVERERRKVEDMRREGEKLMNKMEMLETDREERMKREREERMKREREEEMEKTRGRKREGEYTEYSAGWTEFKETVYRYERETMGNAGYTYERETRMDLGQQHKKVKMEPKRAIEPPSPKPNPVSKVSGRVSSYKPTPTLGLLNGSYEIDFTINTSSCMILCLDKNKTSIWGEFQLCLTKGVFFMPERPWQISYSDEDVCPFEWRAMDFETELPYSGPHCHGVMRFLGNGNVSGTFFNLPWLTGKAFDREFQGHRTSGKNETRTLRDAWSMREEFENIGYESEEIGRLHW